MKKRFLLIAVIAALVFALFGCSVEKVGETFTEGDEGIVLKRFIGTSTQQEYAVPDEYDGSPVTELGWMSLSNAEYLETVKIGKNVLRIDPWAFSNCQKLKEIVVSEDNPNFCSVDGVLFNKDKTVLLVFPNQNAKDYVVPETVTEIGENAFYKCENLETVQFPSGLLKISDRGFFRTAYLAPPAFPNTLQEIGADAFAFFRTGDADVLKKRNVPDTVFLPASVKKIGYAAFYGSSITEMRHGAAASEVEVGDKWLPIKSGSVGSTITVVWGAQA